MTKYDPYKGMKPYRGRKTLSTSQRQRWGALAATSLGVYMYNRFTRQTNLSKGITGGTIREIQFDQPAATTLAGTSVQIRDLVSYPNEAPGGHVNKYTLGGPLSQSSPLQMTVILEKAEHGHSVGVNVLRLSAEDGNYLITDKVLSTTNSAGVASFTFTAEDMLTIGTETRTGVRRSAVRFEFVVDGDYTTPVNVECPIGA